MNFLPITLLIAFTVQEIYSANILVILPLPLYSFTANYMPIFKGLAARGHNVTLVTPFPQKHPEPNLTDIVFPRLDNKIFGKCASLLAYNVESPLRIVFKTI